MNIYLDPCTPSVPHLRAASPRAKNSIRDLREKREGGKVISKQRAGKILSDSKKVRLLVLGDLMLDQFVWGNVRRISPEAPVPVVEFERESYMPGGAANVARNLTSLQVSADLVGLVGRDDSARHLKRLLQEQHVNCDGILGDSTRPTSIKTRIIAHQQQMVRVDREQNGP